MRISYQYNGTRKKRTVVFLAFGICFSVVSFLSLAVFSPASCRRRLYVLPEYFLFEAFNPTWKSLASDVFYIQAILSFTDRFDTYGEKVKWIQRNLALSLVLDPRMRENYFFGGVVVGNNSASIKAGIKFLKKYRYLNPGDWHIPYWIGFDYYLRGDFVNALRYYKQAASFPSSPPFLKSIQPMLYYKAGRIKLGIMFLKGLLSQNKNKKDIRWIERKLLWLKNISYLQEKEEEFKDIFGRLPRSLEEMEEKGVIPFVPSDPFGKGYFLDSEGRIRSRF